MQLDHINISAPPDLLVEVRDFYCDLLGLAEGFRPMFSRKGFWLYSEGKPIIHLVESLDHHRNEKQGYFDHFALRATGLTKLIAKLDAAGIGYKMSYLAETDLSQVFCKDPSGTRVEINFPGESV
jgi:catechol 2,3-dioxygenase-like lactoylglutathione lyase family enzyme